MVRKNDNICKKVALMYGVSPRYVTMVRNGERNNEAILASIMDLKEGEKILLEEVKKLVPEGATKKCKPCVYNVGRK